MKINTALRQKEAMKAAKGWARLNLFRMSLTVVVSCQQKKEEAVKALLLNWTTSHGFLEAVVEVDSVTGHACILILNVVCNH